MCTASDLVTNPVTSINSVSHSSSKRTKWIKVIMAPIYKNHPPPPLYWNKSEFIFQLILSKISLENYIITYLVLLYTNFLNCVIFFYSINFL